MKKSSNAVVSGWWINDQRKTWSVPDCFETLFSEFSSFAFDGEAARIFGKIRTDLTRKGTPIGPYDLQIAAIALANDCVLVTHNVGEFSRITGLKLEDWEVA